MTKAGPSLSRFLRELAGHDSDTRGPWARARPRGGHGHLREVPHRSAARTAAALCQHLFRRLKNDGESLLFSLQTNKTDLGVFLSLLIAGVHVLRVFVRRALGVGSQLGGRRPAIDSVFRQPRPFPQRWPLHSTGTGLGSAVAAVSLLLSALCVAFVSARGGTQPARPSHWPFCFSSTFRVSGAGSLGCPVLCVPPHPGSTAGVPRQSPHSCL